MTTALLMPRFTSEQIPEPLRTELRLHGDTIVVFAVGEIDVSSADRLRDHVLGLAEGARRIVLDLEQVVFIDSSGLHCILAIDQALRDAGVGFALVPGPQAVQRLFEITRTDQLLRFVKPA
jgi:anti-sigma B factor antagonist